MGFVKTQKDTWETKQSTHGWVKVQTSFEEWQIDVRTDTLKEYQEFISNLNRNGIYALTYMSKSSVLSGKSVMRLGTLIRFGH